MKYFDRTKSQLISIERKANSDFWDEHWKPNENIKKEIIKTKDTFFSRITRQYLKPGDGLILEGGCGKGQNVASLVNNGYKVIGIDNAEKTIRILNQYVPELDIRFGDVRKLQFDDNYFIGYWSVGVIEHFWEGYKYIALDMYRVIKNGGYLFLTFPHMSFLRRIKSRLVLYDYGKRYHQMMISTNLS